MNMNKHSRMFRVSHFSQETNVPVCSCPPFFQNLLFNHSIPAVISHLCSACLHLFKVQMMDVVAAAAGSDIDPDAAGDADVADASDVDASCGLLYP